MSTPMKYWQIADLAIRNQDTRMAEGLCIRLNRAHNLNASGVREYLAAHGVDLDLWEELLSAV
jgi:hypothetical protein